MIMSRRVLRQTVAKRVERLVAELREHLCHGVGEPALFGDIARAIEITPRACFMSLPVKPLSENSPLIV